MTAPQLLEAIEARGGVARVKDNGGAIVLNVAPFSLSRELAPDIRRLKPQLIELLEMQPVHRWRDTPDDIARARVKPELAQRMDDDDILQLGRLLLKLDNGEEIE